MTLKRFRIWVQDTREELLLLCVVFGPVVVFGLAYLFGSGPSSVNG